MPISGPDRRRRHDKGDRPMRRLLGALLIPGRVVVPCAAAAQVDDAARVSGSERQRPTRRCGPDRRDHPPRCRKHAAVPRPRRGRDRHGDGTCTPVRPVPRPPFEQRAGRSRHAVRAAARAGEVPSRVGETLARHAGRRYGWRYGRRSSGARLPISRKSAPVLCRPEWSVKC